MENIALAFSGGGFRAACFSLGTLSYLDHLRYKDKPVLEDVKYISSTSGEVLPTWYTVRLFSGANLLPNAMPT